MQQPRYFDGHRISYERYFARHWIGWIGYVRVPMYEVRNPAYPERPSVILTEAEFFALTYIATLKAAA